MSDEGFETRLWYPRSTTPAERVPLPPGPLALSRELFGGEELTLSREANAHTVEAVSRTQLELFANPKTKTPLLVVAGWHFRDFQEGVASDEVPWPIRPSELSKPRHLVAGSQGALGLFRAAAHGPHSLPIHLVPLPSALVVEAGQRARLELPLTVVVGEAAIEIVAASTLAPPKAPTLRGAVSVDVGELSARLSMASRLDDAVLRHCLQAPHAEPPARHGRLSDPEEAPEVPFYRIPGAPARFHVSALYPRLQRELEQLPSEPWLLLPVLGDHGQPHLALVYRSGKEVRVLVSTSEVDRFVAELQALLSEHVPETRATPWLARAVTSHQAQRALSVPQRFGALSTRSVAMASVLDELESVASSEIRVLFLGETGTGKDFAARELHKASRRAAGPFVACNIGSIPPHLIDSELFGHVKGAFTGATSDRLGLFREANGGTLFLDEIGDASAQTQTSLLRVLETRSVRPVGTDRERPIDVRLLAAASRDLDAAQKAGTFRKDLYHRLLGIAVVIPPLRERLEDLPELALSLVAELCTELDVPTPRLSSAALDALLARPWPGNVRELRTTLQAALVRARGADVLTTEHLSAPSRGRLVRHSLSPQPEGDAKSLIPFPPSIIQLANESIRQKALCRPSDTSRRVARATARAVALYLRLHEPGELTGTLGRDAKRLFQPDWLQSDRPGLEALLHQLNAGAARPLRLEQLQIVLIAAGWV